MDNLSSSHDIHHVAEQEQQQQELPILTTKSLHYHSLLLELHTLDPGDGIWSTPRDLPLTRQDMLTLRQEVKLQQMIFMLLQNHGLGSESLVDIQTMAETEAEQIQELVEAFTDDRGGSDITDYGVQCRSHLTKFLEISSQEIKPRVKEFCLEIVDRLLQDRSSTTGDYGIFRFINVILFKLKDFMNLKPNLIDPVKKQMQILAQMLNYAPIIARKMTNLDKNLQNFLELFEPWVNTAAAIVIPYWVDEYDEKPFSTVSSSLYKFNLNIMQYVKAYILVIKALRPSNASEILVMRNTVEQFIEIILENFIVSMDDQFDMFREGLAFWTALLVNPPDSNLEQEKLICSQTHLLLDQAESLICSLCLGLDVAERRNTLLSDFLEKINRAKAEVRQLQVHQTPGLLWDSAHKVISRGDFDLLLGNLRKKFEVEAGFLPFEKHLIAKVHEELSLLRPMFELQDVHEDLRDIWVQATNIAHNVDYNTDYCLVSADVPIWSNMMHLSNAIEKIQSIEPCVSKIRQNDRMYSNIVRSAKLNSQRVLPGRQEAYDATIKDDFNVGFIEEEQRVLDFLMSRNPRLDVVAVVGMGGQGKTHLVQRVIRGIHVKHRFYIHAWCCISQSYDVKKAFRDILESSSGQSFSPKKYQYLTAEDLAHRLRICLRGRRYLIVLDDMWDAEAWRDLKFSFPDDNNGSRIVLTSRSRDVALKLQPNLSIVELHPLSHEESWNLMQMKVFRGDGCPPSLYEIGKTITENCKGLPSAIVVVADLLKKDKNVKSWKQIFKSLKPLIASVGSMGTIDLSYKHLPDYLKPCFLYLGAFEKDEKIDAKQLIQLWIAEGFVQSDEKKTREVLAKDYLRELVSRSLVTVSQRNSRNGIKKCHVHDLVHQLCRIKAREEMIAMNPNYDYIRAILGKSSVSNPLFSDLLHSVRRYGLRRLDFLRYFKLCRVLDLGNAVVGKSDFYNLTQLIHLRLLAVVYSFPIPPSIVNLLRLEVLRFHAGPALLPSVVFKMSSLQHIYVTGCAFDYIDWYDRLVNNTSSQLTSLETLTYVVFKDELSFKKVAQSLQNLLKLGFECYHFCFRLSSYFKRLEFLRLRVVYGEDKVISPSILDFPFTLKKLNLDVTRGRLSSAMISLIGTLNHLEVLKLVANFENDTWYVEDGEFLQLKYFDFRSSSVQEWEVSDESFPCLEQLIVRKCHELGELPSIFSFICTLRRIEVEECSDSLKNSFEQIVDDQMGFGNEGLQYSIT